MTKRICINEEIGQFLHAYEIGILTDAENGHFESHLLSCDFCLERVQKFQTEAELLRSSGQIRTDVEYAAGNSGLWKQYLWPQLPLPFRPAFLMILCVLMIYPALLGVRNMIEPDFQDVNVVYIYPGRSVHDEVRVDFDHSIVLSFVYEGAIDGKKYQLELSEDEGGKIIHKQDYSDFRGSIGKLLLETGTITNKDYLFKINDPEDSSTMGYQTHYLKLRSKEESKQ